jgi:hypothetical protein
MVRDDLLTHLTTAEAAKRLRMTRQGLLLLIKRGEIVCLKTPLGYLFDPMEVERARKARLKSA